MRVFYRPKFKVNLSKFSKEIRAKFHKQINFLLQDLRYPSLHAKKYDEVQGIWQARVDRNVRFYFLIKDDFYILLEIKSHPK